MKPDEAIEPLTRRNAAGHVLERWPDVEDQIREALTLEADQIGRRAAIAGESTPGYLKSETLVYLVRRAHRAGDVALVHDLTVAVLGRCTGVLRRRLGGLGAAALEEGSAVFAAQLFGRILDGDRGDFLQVRFWVVVENMAISTFDRLLRERHHAGQTIPLSSIAGYDQAADDVESHQTADAAQLVAASDEDAVITNDVLRDALSRIKEPYRTAYLLRHYAGWPIEDQDPTVPTISRKFGVDPRTIRNWLKRADNALQAWRGEQDQ